MIFESAKLCNADGDSVIQMASVTDQGVEVRVFEEQPLPAGVDIQALVSYMRAAAGHSGLSDNLAINLYFCDDEAIRELNRDYRQLDSVTDVLSFPQNSEPEFVTPAELPHELGDVFVCVPRAVEQASEYGHSAARELAFLAVHGTLHLLGFDHETDEDRAKMRAVEEEVLATIPR